METTDGEEMVLQPPLREHPSLQAPPGAEEERPSARPLAHELVGQNKRRIEVPTRAPARENGDGALMHGPSFRQVGAAHRLGRCS